MRLTDEIDAIEARMVEPPSDPARDIAAVVALTCFVLLCMCWMAAAVMP
jgi:hypothetical protein